jgi:FSR family fosmidomycin resistance protein-like MFS transporter
MDDAKAASGSPMRVAVWLGGVHALVDAACAATLYAEVASDRLPWETLASLVLFYNCLAFGLQWLFGLIADLRGSYRFASAAGTLLVASSAAIEPLSPWTGAALAGIGNAFFHVGAGGVVLRQSGGRASDPGIFVGPGAAGLAAGLWLGLNTVSWRLPVMVLLLSSTLLLVRFLPSAALFRTGAAGPAPPGLTEGRSPEKRRVRFGLLPGALPVTLAVLLILCSVQVRAGIGGLLAGSWQTPAFAAFSLAAAAMAGKCAGGFLADRLGWRRSSTLALVVAAPLVAAGIHRFDAALAGMVIFQSTMPVTLAAVYLAFPRRPGLAFGLPSLALLLGALPALAGLLPPAALNPFVVPLVLCSALLLFLGLIPSCVQDGYNREGVKPSPT